MNDEKIFLPLKVKPFFLIVHIHLSLFFYLKQYYIFNCFKLALFSYKTNIMLEIWSRSILCSFSCEFFYAVEQQLSQIYLLGGNENESSFKKNDGNLHRAVDTISNGFLQILHSSYFEYLRVKYSEKA